ncbi:MAG: sigma-70 family RNA polymerase sigma factor [Thermoleophilia bacterium]|nr:sigma-70 family RNA polymerase sigma factor [Thermoleophilia bacterium]
MPTPPAAPGLAVADFGDLVAAETPGLYRFALSLTRDPVQAEDLVQDTFLRALERRGQFRGGSSVATWLHRILHNLAVDRSRRRAREVLTDEVVEGDWRDDRYSVDAETVVQRAQVREEVEDALLRVPFASRAVLVLHDVEGWTVERIADQIGVSLPAAKQRLRRGRMAMVSAMARGAERRAALDGVPLRCWDARQWVSDYLDGGLAADRRAMIERHLGACPTCPPLYASLVGAQEALTALRDPDTVVNPDLARRIAVRMAGG